MAPQPPDSVEELSAAGNESFRNGQFAEASAIYSRALKVLQAQGSTWTPLFGSGCSPSLRRPKPASRLLGASVRAPPARFLHPSLPPSL